MRHGNLKKTKGYNRQKDNNGNKEADDKLMGDNPDIDEAQPGKQDEGPELKNAENIY